MLHISNVNFPLFSSLAMVTPGCMGTAVWIFTAKATTEKTLTADHVI